MLICEVVPHVGFLPVDDRIADTLALERAGLEEPPIFIVVVVQQQGLLPV